MTGIPRFLKAFLDSKGTWHRFIVFDQPVKTVERAGGKVDVDRIAKNRDGSLGPEAVTGDTLGEE